MNNSRRNNIYTRRDYNRREAYAIRSAIVRREKILILTIFCMALIMSLFICSYKVNAGNINKDCDSVKRYKSVTIYLGDTFETIAEQYMSVEYSSESKYIDELLSINGMTRASKLIPGNKIIIPYYMSKSIDENPVIEFSLAK